MKRGRPFPTEMVVVLGSINLDLIVCLPRLPLAGETLAGMSFTTAPGGKGANQALAAHAAGAMVGLAGAVGRDDYARAALVNLEASGIDLTRVESVDAVTGVALIQVADDGQNTVSVVAGANGHVRAAQVPDAWLSPDTVVLMQLEVPVAEVTALARRAHQRKSRVILNATPAAHLSESVWAAIDVLIVNESEASIVAAGANLPMAPLEFACAAWRRFGCVVVVTLGEHGALACDSDGPLELPAASVTVLDATGAGDAFCGAFAHAWQRRETLRRAVEQGIQAGAHACAWFGAQSGR